MGIIAQDTLVMLAQEASYGAGAEGTLAVPVETISADNNFNLISRDDDKVGSEFGLTSLEGRITRQLGITMKAYPGDEIGFLFWQLFGAATSTDVGTPSTTAYQHIFDLKQSNLLTNSLALELFEAGITSDKYDGVVITGINITGSNDSVVKLEITVIAQGREDGNSLASESFTITAEKPYMFFNVVLNYNSSQRKVNSWNVNIQSGLLADNFKQSQEIEEPVANDRLVVTASFEEFFADRAMRTVYEALTTAPFDVTITSKDMIGATATPFSFKVELPDAEITDPVTPSGDAGKMVQTVNLKGYKGTLATPTATTNCRATITNGTAAYT